MTYQEIYDELIRIAKKMEIWEFRDMYYELTPWHGFSLSDTVGAFDEGSCEKEFWMDFTVKAQTRSCPEDITLFHFPIYVYTWKDEIEDTDFHISYEFDESTTQYESLDWLSVVITAKMAFILCDQYPKLLELNHTIRLQHFNPKIVFDKKTGKAMFVQNLTTAVSDDKNWPCYSYFHLKRVHKTFSERGKELENKTYFPLWFDTTEPDDIERKPIPKCRECGETLSLESRPNLQYGVNEYRLVCDKCDFKSNYFLSKTDTIDVYVLGSGDIKK